jgi:hypothetical protein
MHESLIPLLQGIKEAFRQFKQDMLEEGVDWDAIP